MFTPLPKEPEQAWSQRFSGPGLLHLWRGMPQYFKGWAGHWGSIKATQPVALGRSPSVSRGDLGLPALPPHLCPLPLPGTMLFARGIAATGQRFVCVGERVGRCKGS